jgi:hypothetical protein
MAPSGAPSPGNDIHYYDPSNTNDASDDTIGSFYARAGDQEVAIESLVFNGTCPGNYAYARVYYWPDDGATGPSQFQNASYGSPSPGGSIDLPFNSDCSANGNWVVTGLNNDQGYFFNLSIVDKAENNFFLISPTYLQSQGTCSSSPNSTPANDAGCSYYATPSKVSGLLPNELNCFIATAAFGSAFAPAVKTLRQFRNHFLMTNDLGRKFVQTYYKYSPKYAHWIQQNDTLKATVRYALAPLWGFAWLSLYYHPVGVLLMLLSLIAFGLTALRSSRGFE